MSRKKIRIVLTNLFSLIALLMTVGWAVNLNTPKDEKLDGLVLVFYAIAGVLIYTRGVEELLKTIQTKPKSEGRLDKVFWIISSWWESWKAGASIRPVQIGYVVCLVPIIAFNLFIQDRVVALALSTGPVAVIFAIATITQPLIVGRCVLEKRLS